MTVPSPAGKPGAPHVMNIKITDNRNSGSTCIASLVGRDIAGEGETPDAALASLCSYVAELHRSGSPILLA